MKSIPMTKIVMSGDLNHANKLFGGKALAWIDEAAAIYVMGLLKGRHNIVTAYMSEISFLVPGEQGDIIEMECDLVSVGKSSITVSLVMRNRSLNTVIVNVEKIVFVNLGTDGKPEPHGYVHPEA